MTDTPEVTDSDSQIAPRIVVVGVGGAGGNAVNNMIESKLAGVEFLVANTDSQALLQSQCERCVQLGRGITQGLGAGSQPEVGRAAAEEALGEIMEFLDGANMVFITAGMGGGTGTGGAPVIARAAREAGILSVGVVTKPFQFEGARRMRMADIGIDELTEYVDTLIVIPNQNLFRVANEKTTFADAFKMADRVLHSGVRGVTDLMVMPGMINLDFADIRSVMSEMGKAIMGTGEGEGERRALEAAEAAVSNPLLDDVSMKGARGVLINITGGLDLTLFEVDQAANRIREEVDTDANIIFGSIFDTSMEGKMRVSVVATGIEVEKGRRPRAVPVSLVVNQRPGKPATPASRTEPTVPPATVPPATVTPSTVPPAMGTSKPETTIKAPLALDTALKAPIAPLTSSMPQPVKTLDTPPPPSISSDNVAARSENSADKSFFQRLAPAKPIPPNTDTLEDEKAPQQAATATPPLAKTDATPRPDSSGGTDPAPEVESDLVAEEVEEPDLALADVPNLQAGPTLELKNEETGSDTAPDSTEASTEPEPKKRSNGIFAWMTGGGGSSPEELFEKADNYYHGQGVRKNLALALRSYRKSAEQGHAAAQNRLGWMYEKGEGVDADYGEAVIWYRRAAEQGHINAMNDLGYMYRQGWGVPQNYSDALLWFRKAAEKSDSYAEYNLGQMYENGWGTEKDVDEAVRWFRRSAARGHEWAAKRLEELGDAT
ncbi:MAG: cell division protein FtsZ [Alphaproteobacteria bacterium]